MKNDKYLNQSFTKLYSKFLRIKKLSNLKKILYYYDNFISLFLPKPKHDFTRKKVLILFNLAFGDGVIFNCCAHLFKEIYKDYEITLICQQGLEGLYQNKNYFDIIIPLNFTKASVNLNERCNVLKAIKKEYYDIVITPVEIGIWSTDVLMTNAAYGKEKISYTSYMSENSIPKNIKKIYTKIYQVKKEESLLSNYFEFINNLNYNKKIYTPQLKKITTTKPNIKISEDYYIIFPSASIELKCWSLDNYAEIANYIYSKTHKLLVLCGINSDQKIINKFVEKLKMPYLNLTCKTNLNDFIYLIKKAKFVITNDTSTYHIAVVNEIPVIVISGGYNYNKYISYNFENNQRYRKPFIAGQRKECFNCREKCKHIKSEDKIWPCLNDITVENVKQKINEMFESIGE